MKASTGFSPTRSESKYWCTEKKPASSCLPGADRCGDSQPFPEKGGKCSAPPGEAVPRLAPPCQADLPGLPCPVCVDDPHTYLILLRFALLRSVQIEGLWQSCIERIYWCHFSKSICSSFVSVSRVGDSRNISTFSVIIICVTVVVCDQ